tara:strand:+ start:704 stop:865 length:162 start_codon:yes stop_codon:yes gene_type:complete
MKKYYMIISVLLIDQVIFAQGVNFPSEPVQAPIGGLGLLVLGGAAIAFKRFKK